MQVVDGHDGRAPRAEVLGGDRVARDLGQVGVHVGRLDVVPAGVALGREQPLARDLLAGQQLPREPRVTDLELALEPGLRDQGEAHPAAVDVDVLGFERGQAVRAVGGGGW